MKLFIRSSACISSQNTFRTDDFLSEVVEYQETRLRAIEPDYRTFADAKQLRRIGHVIRMGLATAMDCLKQAGVDMPGAIITGTALGCIEDTLTFLNRMVEFKEQLLPPTAFIQSTHNTVAAQIALSLKCHNYNNTFVHKGISFESALLDAQMLLLEGEANDILVGGMEEMTDDSFIVLSRLGLFKRQPLSNLSLFNTQTRGTIGGEGAAFFLLTDRESKANLANFEGVQTFYKPGSLTDIEQKINGFLIAHSLTMTDVDLVITGRNGDPRNDEVYQQLSTSLFKAVSLANYKHLCGEYPVSTSFALWLAVNILKRGQIPPIIAERMLNDIIPKKILIYNCYLGSYHSLMLVSGC